MWNYLLIICAVCAVLTTVGFYKFVYFLSIGYGFAVAGAGIAIFILALVNGWTEGVLILALIQMLLFIAYGC
nr:steroid reductase [Clostridia bacterium]